jgi:hypothetical protein
MWMRLGVNMLLAGVVVGGVGTLIQSQKAAVGGYLYGALPLAFLYLYALAWHQGTAPEFAWHTALGGTFWLLFVYLVGFLGMLGLANLPALALALALTGGLLWADWRLNGSTLLA